MRCVLAAIGLVAVLCLAGCSGPGGDTGAESGTFQAKRKWWICRAEIADADLPFMKLVRMRIVFRDAEDLAKVKHGFYDEQNGWEGGKDALVTYEKAWGTDESLDRQGLANCQVIVTTAVGDDLQTSVVATEFRLDGEASWTRLGDYVRVAESEPGRLTYRSCRRCSALLPLEEKNCENCQTRG